MRTEIVVIDENTKNEVAAAIDKRMKQHFVFIVIDESVRKEVAKFAIDLLSDEMRNKGSILELTEASEASKEFMFSMIYKVPPYGNVVAMLKWKQEYAAGYIRLSFPSIHEKLQSYPENLRDELARGILEKLIMPPVATGMEMCLQAVLGAFDRRGFGNKELEGGNQ